MKIRIKFFNIVIAMVVVLQFCSLSNAFSAVLNNIEGMNVNTEYAQNNDSVWAIVWLNIAPNYYTYAPTDIVDDSVKPVQFTFRDASGKALPVRYPMGVERRDFYDTAKIISSYSSSTPFFISLGKASTGEEFNGTLNLLLCSANRCQPVNFSIKLQVPNVISELNKQNYFQIWQDSIVRASNVSDISSFESLNSVVAQTDTLDDSTITWAFAPRIFTQELEVSGLGRALLFGFLAGIILNFMPCVFPVLALKANAFLATHKGLHEESLADFRIQNLLFAAGMLTLFLILALFLGTAGFIWGQFYQNNIFVASMVVLIFTLALSMFGVFSLPMIDLKSGSAKSPKTQAFLTGMVTTLLATPCSGPLLGGVLSWAFTQPLHLLVLVFVSVGLGMSSPYLILALKPQLSRFLPRPGSWMLIVERLVGFFLVATALYLLSILPSGMHISMLAGLVIIAFWGWLWGQFGGLNATWLRRKALGLGFVLCAVLAISYSTSPLPRDAQWDNFDAQSFQEDLGKVPMLVEFTADWCPNCKFIEKTVLTSDFLNEIKSTYNLKLVKVDITRSHPQAEALLHALNSSSIPLTAIFTTGFTSASPIVLRDIYTQDTLIEALESVF